MSLQSITKVDYLRWIISLTMATTQALLRRQRNEPNILSAAFRSIGPRPME
jgi:hypothetical protein